MLLAYDLVKRKDKSRVGRRAAVEVKPGARKYRNRDNSTPKVMRGSDIKCANALPFLSRMESAIFQKLANMAGCGRIVILRVCGDGYEKAYA
jgi:hypothetical protein